ncbi:MAG: aspartyl/asparaginyl beta-hydroxylase domain-containing protein [Sphingorhabdus sp.]
MMKNPAIPAQDISEAEADARLRQSHFDIGALLAKADHRFTADDHRAANSFYTAAAQYIGQNDVMAAQHAADAQRATAMIEYCGQLFRQHLNDYLDNAGFTKSNRHPRFQKSLEMMLGESERPPTNQAFPQTPLVYYYPDLPYVDFADPVDFPWRGKLEEQYPAMRREAEALLAHGADFKPYIKTTEERPQGDVHGMLENPDWSTLYLWENGAAVDDHVKLCPTIFEAVMENAPLCHIGPRAPSVMLSLLRPGAHIPPHTGMLNCRYICHLPLIIPGGCGFRVGERRVEWEEGEMLMFDDTVQHEAWNKGDENRVVLIIDIWRPELDDAEREQVTALFAAVDSY